MLKITNLKVDAGEKRILNGISLEVEAGEVVAIMGLNGSGKSTLAYSLAGHPKYLTTGKIELDGEDIEKISPNGRAEKGLFLANQHPVTVEGLSANSFLRQVYKKRNAGNAFNVVEFRKWLEIQAKALDLNPELLKRGLNDGFSGGEKKKLEILQMLVFNPRYVILDEIDSGLDVDALAKIAKTVAYAVREKKIGVIVITHYNRILKYLKADKVVVIQGGKVVKTGGPKLAEEIEVLGYSHDR